MLVLSDIHFVCEIVIAGQHDRMHLGATKHHNSQPGRAHVVVNDKWEVQLCFMALYVAYGR